MDKGCAGRGQLAKTGANVPGAGASALRAPWSRVPGERRDARVVKRACRQPLRILHIIPGLTIERGGPTTVVCALSRHQVASGHQVHVLYTDQGLRSGEQLVELPAGVTFERATVWGSDRLAFAPRFAGMIRRRLPQYDIVHIHSIFTHPVQAALREVRRAGVLTILRPCGHLHRYSLQRTRWLKRLYLGIWGDSVLRACSCWHYTSEQEAAESWPGGQRPFFVLPNGIEPQECTIADGIARQYVARKWPELSDAPYVLFLGRLHPKKRLDLLLEAFLAGAPANFKLVVVGPDECALWKPLAWRLQATPQAATRVLRLNTVTGRDKVPLLAAATLLALPSEHENFGNAALEALACGTPALLSPHVDLAVTPEADDYCYRARLDKEAWAEQFSTLLSRPADLAAAGEAVRQTIIDRFSWQRITAQLTERYRWVLAGCPPLPVPADPVSCPK